ncbi:hypothetical protein BDV25DRAFT_169481 [Aspergillus avenaceus]|uniref:SMP-30/Gluconolactonase/LRE-like region domain-containing protein n=1 Tax=Aspergillus avenaceus TaxID=36643 RepID=A0A5N6U3H0_ASPAV|nr:hypothetical protein BDV25DRAFT_169481 [Aspergillus avenaceus]
MATNLSIPGNTSHIPSAFQIHNPNFLDIIGQAPTLELLLQDNDVPFAHEASVFIPSTDELYLTSNRFTDPKTNQSTIQISKVNLTAHPLTHEVINTAIPMANGAVNHNDGILFCAQGNTTHPSGLYQMSIQPPHESTLLLSTFYSRELNSPNDVVIHSDNSIWFTDPIYAYMQGFRPKPQLPNQVYRFDPATKNIRVVADGLGRPNGIAFSPDEKIVYITDTSYDTGKEKVPTNPSTIYAFDLVTINNEPFLVNRRVFAMADTGAPDGVKVDMDGNVYAGCGDGVSVWSAGGVLLGKILVKDGVANFSFGRDGQMFIMNENKLLTARLNRKVKGGLLGI